MVMRRERIPIWTWVVISIAFVLVIAVVISVAATRVRYQAAAPEPQVPTGRPQDFTQQPPPTPPSTATPAPATGPATAPSAGTGQQTTQPSQPATSGASGGSQPEAQPSQPASMASMPRSIDFGGETWRPAAGPVQIEVVTTGQYSDDHIIYAKAGDQPPYKALYLETSPNSGQFYKYVRGGQ